MYTSAHSLDADVYPPSDIRGMDAAVRLGRDLSLGEKGDDTMGKHAKKEECNACNGAKGQWVTDNGHEKRRWEPCVVCNGTGEQ
ncbi:hypothetical protein ABZ801_28135 [Actinomadura sp. NPDC047616]|uniref:hypothetical protein n=1 Tax=Actinomadura sp. NPDC047616 TaxID=3155914 RepID=UPI0033C059F6